MNGACICKTGWTGPGCEEVARPLDERLDVQGMGAVTMAHVIVTPTSRAEKSLVVTTVSKPVILLIVARTII